MMALRALAFPAFILAFGAVSLTAQSERVSQQAGEIGASKVNKLPSWPAKK